MFILNILLMTGESVQFQKKCFVLRILFRQYWYITCVERFTVRQQKTLTEIRVFILLMPPFVLWR